MFRRQGPIKSTCYCTIRRCTDVVACHRVKGIVVCPRSFNKNVVLCDHLARPLPGSMCPSISSRTAAKRTPSKGGASGSGKPSSKGKRKGGKKEKKEKKTKKEKKGKAPKDAAKGKLVGS